MFVHALSLSIPKLHQFDLLYNLLWIFCGTTNRQLKRPLLTFDLDSDL